MLRTNGADDERATVAVELHDLLVHRLSALSIQASGAAAFLRDRHPEPAESFRQIAESAGEALLELRGLGYALGTPPLTTRAPQPGLSALPGVVEAWTARGAAVELRVGDLPSHVPGAVALAVVRILEAALAAAAIDGVGLEVDLRRVPGCLVLELHRPIAVGSSRDHDLLTRMRARASAVGGKVSQRATPDTRSTRVTFRL